MSEPTSRHLISVTRDSNTIEAFMTPSDIGTDAMNALLSIPGVGQPDIVSETDVPVTLEYSWTGEARYWETDEHLSKYGLRRI